MASRGFDRTGRGRTEPSKRYMMVGTKDNAPSGAKTGVVAPVPINTPSLRREIHGAQAVTGSVNSLTRSSAAGWGSVGGENSVPVDNKANGGTAGRTGGRDSGSDSRRSGKVGDDVFTRHFPDLRAGLEQGERQDAASKASSKVVPLRKAKADAAKEQGPSLRPRAALKPTGSAGGGSAAAAAAQAAVAEAAHNRVAAQTTAEERRRNGPSFADEISGKSRWQGRMSPEQVGGRDRTGGSRTWERNREGAKELGRDRIGGRDGVLGSERSWDRDSWGNEGFQDKEHDRGGATWNRDRDRGSGTRDRECGFSGVHGHTSGGSNLAPVTTYVRQHGPPPRKLASQQPPVQNQQEAPTHQPTRSSAYSSRSSSTSKPYSKSDAWDLSISETNKQHSPSSPAAKADSASVTTPTPASTSSPQSGCYVRTYGPPRCSPSGGDAAEELDEQGTRPTNHRPGGHVLEGDEDPGTESVPRSFGGSWGESEPQDQGSKSGDVGGEQLSSGRWKETIAPPVPAPTNSRWKEPKEDPAVGSGACRWKVRDEAPAIPGQGRWTRGLGESGGEDSTTSTPNNASWKGRTDEEWKPEADGVGENLSPVSGRFTKKAEEEQGQDGDNAESGLPDGGVIKGAATTTGSGTSPVLTGGGSPDVPQPYRSPFTQSAATLPHTTSWEPQLPRAGEHTWSAPSREPQTEQGQGHGSTGQGSQPWGDPWGTSGFNVPTDGEGSSAGMASLLPSEHRKDRYLPPALRNRDSAQGSQGDTPVTPVAVPEAAPAPPPSDCPTQVGTSHQDMLLPGTVANMGCGADITGSAHFEQQQVMQDWQEEQKHPHKSQPILQVEEPLHQQQQQQQHQPQQQPQQQKKFQQQVQESQRIQLHEQRSSHDQEYRPEHTSVPPLPHEESRQHQTQDQVQCHHFQPEHFRHQHFRHNHQPVISQPLQDQVRHNPIQDRLQQHHFQPEHAQRQQLHLQHSQMHQQHQQIHQHQQVGQLQQQHLRQGQQQLPQAQHSQHLMQQHQQYHQHQHQQRQLSPPQQLQQAAFLMQAPGITYADPPGSSVGGLGGFAHMSPYPRDLQSNQPQHQGPPSGPYGYRPPDSYHKG